MAQLIQIKRGSGTPLVALLNGEPAWDATNHKLYIGDGSVNTQVGVGTVTSVAFGLGATLSSIFSVSGSPITSSGTLTLAASSQTQNLIYASPNGASGTPVFRAIAMADLPIIAIAYGGTNSSTALVNDRIMISAAGAIIEADTATYPSVTELSYIKGLTSNLQDNYITKNGIIIQQVSNGTASSGAIETITYSMLIPANTVNAGDLLRIEWRTLKTAGTNNMTSQLYWNTTNAIPATTKRIDLNSATTNSWQQHNRLLGVKVKNGTGAGTISFPGGTSASSDLGSTASTPQTNAIDWGADVYFILTVLAGNITTSCVGDFIRISR